MKSFGFTKKERSSFPYWFSHWCAFNLTAMCLHVWKIKYLFHDIEKPWLKLFLSYDKVQKFHRIHNSHHLEYGRLYGWDKMDWMGSIIDWECSRLTKKAQPLNAKQFTQYLIENKDGKRGEEEINAIKENVLPLLETLDL